MEKICEERCPKCGATLKNQDLDYGASELGDGFIYYPVTCKKCGCEFKEYYDLVYSSTEYEDEELDFDNLYELFTTIYKMQIKEGRNIAYSKRRILRAKEVSEKITELLESYNGIENNFEEIAKEIRKLRRFEVGVGDTATDEAIAKRFKEMLLEVFQPNAVEDMGEAFYEKLHFGD